MRLLSTCFALALIVLFMPIGHSAAYQSTITDVSIFHALPDVGEVDFYINDIFAGTAGYGETAGYVVVQPGAVRIRAFAPGSDPTSVTPIFEGSFDATEKLDWNVALVGSSASPELKAFPVACQPIAFGLGRLNFVHTIAGAGPVVVSATAADGTTTTLVDRLDFGEPQAVEVPAGIYTVNVDGVVNDVTVNVSAGSTGTAFITGPTADVPANLQVFFGAADSPESAGYLRLVHAIPSGTPVDIYLNDSLFAANLSPEQATIYIALAPATYAISVFGAGSDANPLFTQTVEVVDGVSTLGVLKSGDYGPGLALFPEDRSAPAADEAKINVMNVGLASVDLTADGAVIVSGLSLGQGTATFSLAEGTYELIVSAGGTPVETLSAFAIADDNASNLRTLIITTEKTIILRGRPDLSQ